MIELVIQSRCIDCDRCVRVCPTNVFDAVPGGPPVIARQSDCQTCFMCELYCPADALYVGPDCEHPEPVTEDQVAGTDWPEQYRRDAGWGKHRDQHPNEIWFMQDMATEALEIRTAVVAARGPDDTAPGPAESGPKELF